MDTPSIRGTGRPAITCRRCCDSAAIKIDLVRREFSTTRDETFGSLVHERAGIVSAEHFLIVCTIVLRSHVPPRILQREQHELLLRGSTDFQ